ncbi:MAG: hypothetical protein HC820_06440 [Hydrococcus sp. RM1_1_31]|nr:hypothetical protein [Hydrococcus sp. RM1_1_31]
MAQFSLVPETLACSNLEFDAFESSTSVYYRHIRSIQRNLWPMDGKQSSCPPFPECLLPGVSPGVYTARLPLNLAVVTGVFTEVER